MPTWRQGIGEGGETNCDMDHRETVRLSSFNLKRDIFVCSEVMVLTFRSMEVISLLDLPQVALSHKIEGWLGTSDACSAIRRHFVFRDRARPLYPYLAVSCASNERLGASLFLRQHIKFR